MDFLTGALPNVMFIAGLMAIGLAVGIEFKIVEVKGNLTKGGRIGAFGVGIALIAVSIILYTRPDPVQTAAQAPTDLPAAPTQMQAGLVVQSQSPMPAATEQASQLPTATEQASLPPTATVATSDDPVADLRTLLAAAVADGRVSRDGGEMIKKLEELEDMLAKSDEKRAAERLRDLQDRFQEGAQKKTVDPAFAAEGIAVIQRIAAEYNLSIPSKK